MTSTGGLASTSSTPTPPDLQSDSSLPTAPLHPTAPDPDVQAAAAHLFNTLLNYSHSDWEQAQREYCLFATTSQLPPDQMIFLPALDGRLSMTPFASMCPFWQDRGSCMHATPMPPVISVLRAPSKCLNAFTGGLVCKPARNGGCTAASNVRRVRPPARRFAGQSSQSPSPTALASPSVLTTLGLCRQRLDETHTSSSSRIALAVARTCSPLPRPNSPPKAPQTFW